MPDDGVTHFADDATLRYIAQLEADRERLRYRVECLRGMLKTNAGWWHDLGDADKSDACMEAAGDMECNAGVTWPPAALSPEAPVDCRVMHCFAELQGASKYPIRQEANHEKVETVLRIAGGLPGDVVGMNDTMRAYVCFGKGGMVMYIDYDATNVELSGATPNGGASARTQGCASGDDT